MTLVLRIAALAVSISTILGCSPTDQHVLPFAERLEKGDPIIYNKEGELAAGCRNREWSDVRLSAQEIETLFFFGDTISVGFGRDNCLRVGSTVSIKNMDQDNAFIDGQVVVKQVVVWKTAAAKKPLNSYFKWQVQNPNVSEKSKKEVETYINAEFSGKIEGKAKDSNTGIIHITQVAYVKGSSNRLTEESFSKAGRQKFEDFFNFPKETKEGTSLCREPWSTYDVTEAQWAKMVSESKSLEENGSKWLTNWSVRRAPICLIHGATVPVKLRVRPGEPEKILGNIKVGVVRQIKKDQINEKFFAPNSQKNFESIKQEILAAFKFPDDNINLFDFEVIDESAPADFGGDL